MTKKWTPLYSLLLLLLLAACSSNQANVPVTRAVVSTNAGNTTTTNPVANPVIRTNNTTVNTAVESDPIGVTSQQAVAVTGNHAGNNDCPTERFLHVTQHPANQNYPAPLLNVTCANGNMIIQSNNITNFEFVQITPNALSAQNFTFQIPINPVPADTLTSVPLGGVSAVTVNGLVIFGPTEAQRDGYRDPYLDEILDYCNGHTAPGGVYHFHAPPKCLFEEYDGQVGLVVGYALDGYPILAPYLCADASCSSVKKVESSWQLTNPNLDNAWEKHSYVAGLSELDQCNGLTFADGSYAYFATDTFPYFMGCYRGVVNQDNFGGGMGGNTPANNGNGQQPPQGNDRQPPPRNGGQGRPPQG